MKSIYAIQPYHVGPSLAVIIPAAIAKELNITPSTIFVLRADKQTKRLLLQATSEQQQQNENLMMSAGESFEASSQLTSSAGAH